MAVIKSVQRGTATISASAQTTTATVTAVDLTNTMLVFGLSKATNDEPGNDFVKYMPCYILWKKDNHTI